MGDVIQGLLQLLLCGLHRGVCDGGSLASQLARRLGGALHNVGVLDRRLGALPYQLHAPGPGRVDRLELGSLALQRVEVLVLGLVSAPLSSVQQTALLDLLLAESKVALRRDEPTLPGPVQQRGLISLALQIREVLISAGPAALVDELVVELGHNQSPLHGMALIVDGAGIAVMGCSGLSRTL